MCANPRPPVPGGPRRAEFSGPRRNRERSSRRCRSPTWSPCWTADRPLSAARWRLTCLFWAASERQVRRGATREDDVTLTLRSPGWMRLSPYGKFPARVEETPLKSSMFFSLSSFFNLLITIYGLSVTLSLHLSSLLTESVNCSLSCCIYT